MPLVLDTRIETPRIYTPLNNSLAFGGTNAVLAFRRSGLV